jgi:hypothetical protein
MPSSPRKLESARNNGAQSHGPITNEGRQAASRNAIQHGLAAQTVVLDNESLDDYETVLQCYLDHFQPRHIVELDLVHQLAAASWRLARSAGIESGLLSGKMEAQEAWVSKQHGDDIPENRRTAIAFDTLAEANGSLSLLNRYQARFHHEYQRILKSLSQMQATRNSREVKLPNEPNPVSEHPIPPASSGDILVSTDAEQLQ